MKHIHTFESFLNEALNNSLKKEIEERLGIKLELFGSGGSTVNGKYPPSVYQIRDKKNPNLDRGFNTLQLRIDPQDDSFYFEYEKMPVETSVTPLKGKNAIAAPIDKLTPEVYQEAVNYVNNF